MSVFVRRYQTPFYRHTSVSVYFAPFSLTMFTLRRHDDGRAPVWISFVVLVGT